MRPHFIFDECSSEVDVYDNPVDYLKRLGEIAEETGGSMNGYDLWDESYLQAALDECEWQPVQAIYVHSDHKADEILSAQTMAALAGANANAREQGWFEIDVVERGGED